MLTSHCNKGGKSEREKSDPNGGVFGAVHLQHWVKYIPSPILWQYVIHSPAKKPKGDSPSPSLPFQKQGRAGHGTAHYFFTRPGGVQNITFITYNFVLARNIFPPTSGLGLDSELLRNLTS
jgi:hypothetical protein